VEGWAGVGAEVLKGGQEMVLNYGRVGRNGCISAECWEGMGAEVLKGGQERVQKCRGVGRNGCICAEWWAWQARSTRRTEHCDVQQEFWNFKALNEPILSCKYKRMAEILIPTA